MTLRLFHFLLRGVVFLPRGLAAAFFFHIFIFFSFSTCLLCTCIIHFMLAVQLYEILRVFLLNIWYNLWCLWKCLLTRYTNISKISLESHVEGWVVKYYFPLPFGVSGVSTGVCGTFRGHYKFVLVSTLVEGSLVVWDCSVEVLTSARYGCKPFIGA